MKSFNIVYFFLINVAFCIVAAFGFTWR